MKKNKYLRTRSVKVKKTLSMNSHHYLDAFKPNKHPMRPVINDTKLKDTINNKCAKIQYSLTIVSTT